MIKPKLPSMAPKLAILAEPPASLKDYQVNLFTGDRLTEYDLLVIAPPKLTNSEGNFPMIETFKNALERRRAEVREFLDLGGVAAVFLRVPTYLRAKELREDIVYSYELFVRERDVTNFGFTDDSGTSRDVLDEDDPLAPYVQKVERWVCTIERGAFVDDPHGYPLAVNRHGRTVAFVEHVGRGSVYWVPPCATEADWRRLVEGLQRSWTSMDDPLLGLAASELKDVAERIDGVRSDARRTISELARIRTRMLETRRRLSEEDRDVSRALQHYRAARHSSPAKALDFLHRMVETIEHVYGGEAKALTELGYSKNTLSDITRPANKKAYRARHEGGENETVPQDELERAFAAADDILGRFLTRRLREL